MLGSNFIDSYQKYQALFLIGVQDWADRLSFLYSTVLFMICTTIVATKTYVQRSIACHVPTKPTGAKFQPYLESFCWVTGTIPLRYSEEVPQTDEEWDIVQADRLINYYQWVPFVLGLQTIMFYLPHVAWQNVTFNRLGADLGAIITKAINALKASSPASREASVANVAQRLELLLFAHRDCREGLWADVRRGVNRFFGLLLVSKRLGTWTVASYLCIKMLYLINCIAQLYLIKEFLGYDGSMWGFGWYLTISLINRSDWKESLYFPRVGFCSVGLRHLGQDKNRYVALCVLPVNMLNEKIYIFLWFWTLAVTFCTAFSIVNWFLRLFVRRRRSNVIRKYLNLGKIPEEKSYPQSGMTFFEDELDLRNPILVEQFISEFLRLDGVFIVNMLTLNAGDVITGEVVRLLWKAWTIKYMHRNFNCDLWQKAILLQSLDEEPEKLEKPV